MRLLVVEDDLTIAANLIKILSKNSFSVDSATHIKTAFDKAITDDYDCLILDRNLPDGDGLTLIPALRQEKIYTPILILTARNQPQETVEGLNIGADDYLVKPFRLEELLARVRALIRRGKRIPSSPSIKIGDLKLNINQQQVIRQGKNINLSPREYAILEYLCLHPCQVIDRVTLMTHAWGEEIDLFSNTVDVHIRYLRRKIDVGKKLKLIKTVRGKGYMVCPE